jgi:hypothetical protein
MVSFYEIIFDKGNPRFQISITSDKVLDLPRIVARTGQDIPGWRWKSYNPALLQNNEGPVRLAKNSSLSYADLCLKDSQGQVGIRLRAWLSYWAFFFVRRETGEGELGIWTRDSKDSGPISWRTKDMVAEP